MLVLTRKIGQTIVIDGDITLHIVQIEGARVRVGIDAPPLTAIVRGELQTLRDERRMSGGKEAAS